MNKTIDAKCNVNAVNAEGVTALHEAVQRKDTKLIEELLVRGADPNIIATSGKFANQSPINLAAELPNIASLMEKASVLPLGPIQNGIVPNMIAKPPSELSVGEPDDASDISASLIPPSVNGTIFSPLKKNSNVDLSTPTLSEIEPETVIDPRLQLLWPKPQHLLQKQGPPLLLPEKFVIKIIPGPTRVSLEKQVDIWTIQTAMLQDIGFKPTLESSINGKDAKVVCFVNTALFQKKESYRILVTETQVQLICSDMSGLWYASCSFLNLVRLCKKDGIPQLKITDWPNLSHRGVGLDMSAGRILTIDYLLFKINTLSLLKFNEIHFYVKIGKDPQIENLVPYIPSELLDLEVYCNYRFMTIVPHIDITPDAKLIPQTFSLFRQVLSLFSNYRSIHIGPILTKKLFEDNIDTNAETQTQTQENWAVGVDDKLRLLGVRMDHTIFFCSNDFNAKLFHQLPLGSVCVQYGTQSVYDFVEPGKKLSSEGIGFILCPGTASWNSLGGIPEVSIRNILNASKCCATNDDAIGIVVMDWAGKTFLNHISISWPGFVVAGGCSWNTSTEEAHIHSNLAAILNYFIFQDSQSTLGDVILEMGKACTILNKTFSNMVALDDSVASQPLDGGSFISQLILGPDDVDLTHMTADAAQKAILRMRKCQASLKGASKMPINTPVTIELYLASDFILWGAKLTRNLVIAGTKPNGSDGIGPKIINAGIANLTATTKTDCANKLLSLMEEYRHVWLKSCYPTGLLESLSIFTTILEKLVPQKKN